MITVVENGKRMSLIRYMRREAAREASKRNGCLGGRPPNLMTSRRERRRMDARKDKRARTYRSLKCPWCGHSYTSRAVVKAECPNCSKDFNPNMNVVEA